MSRRTNIYIFFLFCVTNFIHGTNSSGLTKPGDCSPAADHTAEMLCAKEAARK